MSDAPRVVSRPKRVRATSSLNARSVDDSDDKGDHEDEDGDTHGQFAWCEPSLMML